MGFLSKDKEAVDTSAINSRKRQSETLINEALILPPTARKISIKPEASLTSKVTKIYNTDNSSNKDVDNVFTGDYEANDSDSAEVPQDANKSSDAGVKSSNLQFTVSIRGSLQVILNRFMYNLQSTQSSGIKRWRCIDYRNNRCMAFLVTKGNVVLNRGNPHCHSFHDKKILAKIEKNAVYSALYELEAHQEKERQKQNDEETDQAIKYITTDASEDLTDLSQESKTNDP